MIWILDEIMRVSIFILCTLATVSAFHFPDFNIYDESSTTMDSACAWFSSMVQSINLYVPKIEDVSFELRSSCARMEYSVSDADLLRNVPFFNASQKTVVVATGWMSELNSPYTEELTNAYLCRGGFNLIVVNTGEYVRTEYIKSAYNTGKLGEFIAVGLKNLKIPGKDIHLIGHSLGAHIVGSAGQHFLATTGEQIGRITGLDPARPCFRNTTVFDRLQVGDAKFIDIIHSNPGETGIEEPVGDVDFFPGGLERTKPGCSLVNLKCSHIKSIDYYIETVYHGNEMNFMASPCGNYTNLEAIDCQGARTPMGFAADENARGIYLLAVNGNAPFGINAKDDAYLTSPECGICNEQF